METKICLLCGEEKQIDKFCKYYTKRQELGKFSFVRAHEKRGKYCYKCINKKYGNYGIRFKWSNATNDEKIEHIKEIFERHVIRNDDGCWGWKGAIHNGGYAVLNFNNKQMGAHRISYMIYYGAMKDDGLVLHHCDNKKCTKPEHLYKGTQKDNVRDCKQRGRRNDMHGEKNPASVLKEHEVKKIKFLLKHGVAMTFLSKKFNVSYQTIYDIKHGKSWKHVD